MKKANTFTVEGRTYETNEKGNRFYVSYGNIVKKRIPEHVFREAEAKWLSEADAELEDRKAKDAESDKAAEDAVNKSKKAKVNKPRKSKDIAFEMDTIEGHITLTAKQVDFIKHIPDTCFYENGLDSTPWCDVLADEIGGQFAGKPMTVGAMISTLREKNLIYVAQDHINGKKAKYFGFTEVGKMIAQKLGLN